MANFKVISLNSKTFELSTVVKRQSLTHLATFSAGVCALPVKGKLDFRKRNSANFFFSGSFVRRKLVVKTVRKVGRGLRVEKCDWNSVPRGDG